ncbi:hypothetical protein AALP_AA8G484100 [Arabis alpina]|uniref:Uncharacterized protein n=1 Tax=Arabis alpina TaxID=50452 RepID=A0A087GE90_ARAAL|nr:hypothetical protein AALP_AA8G484100 [Arabis alpina]
MMEVVNRRVFSETQIIGGEDNDDAPSLFSQATCALLCLF